MSRPPKKPRSLQDVLAAQEEAVPAEVAPPSGPAVRVSQQDRLVGVVQHMAEGDRDRIRLLAFHERTSAQQLGMEAWNLLLEKRGLPPLKPAAANIPSGLKR